MQTVDQLESSREKPALIVAVIVLYKMSGLESPAYRGLVEATQHHPSIEEAIECIICDNSPYLQETPPGFSGIYLQDLENAGLAKRYNYALETAAERGIPWLLLLDQDTVLTEGYLLEAIELVSALLEDETIVALAPKLVERGEVLSPLLSPWVRHRATKQIGIEDYGKSATPIQVFNSGALLRVNALQSIGGFPSHFWLDYLDHATFHALQANGGKVFLMHAQLEHSLSLNELKGERSKTIQKRQLNTMRAERDYHRVYSNWPERIKSEYHFSKYMVRVVGGALIRGEFSKIRDIIRFFSKP